MKTNFTEGELTFQYIPSGKQYTYPKHYEIDCGGKTIGAMKHKGDAKLFIEAKNLLSALIKIRDASSEGEVSLHDQWVIRTCQEAIANALGE